MNPRIQPPPPLWQIEFLLADLTSQQTAIPRPRIKAESRLLEDLHIDSLDLVELILSIEEEFDVTIPDDIGQQMFVRQPVTIGVLAEIVRRQWGTGAPERKMWHAKRPSVTDGARVPFTQLGGTISHDEWQALLKEPLYERMASTAEGFEQFRRRTDGMRCVLIPSADVELGSDAVDTLPDQRPAHQAALASFLMDAEPVSVKAFARFLNSTGPVDKETVAEWCGVESDDRRGRHFQLEYVRNEWRPPSATEEQPMILVSWFGANAYSLWANCRDWRWYRGDGTMPEALRSRAKVELSVSLEPATFLPSEAQWEYSARGAASKLYPWGNSPATMELARIGLHRARESYADELPLSAVTDKLGMSPFGLHHMAGNIWQWCADWYAAGFYLKPDARSPNPQNTCPTGVRCERGGSWIGPGELARSSYRRGRPPTARGRCLGFRCAARADEAEI